MYNSLLWVEKYSPNHSSNIIGNEKNIKIIKDWLTHFKNRDITKCIKNCLLISGSSGIGKTIAASLILKEFDYDVIEFNANELRSAKLVRDRLKSFTNSSNILKIINSSKKIGIIMDEIDVNLGDKGIIKEIINYIINDESLIENDKKKKKLTNELHINKYPVICICNNITSPIKNLLSECIHVNFELPNNKDIMNIIDKICYEENLNLEKDCINLLLNHCQNDIRRTINILENLKLYFINKKITLVEIENLIDTFAQKDLDITLYDCIYKINNKKLDINEVLNYYNIDKSYVPLLVHENFNRNLDINKKDTKKNKLIRMFNYYENLTIGMKVDGIIYENNSWELNDYVGLFTCVSANKELNNEIESLKVVKYTNLDSSPVFSKINYKFYNLKLINEICKKLGIRLINFQDFTFTLYKSCIINEIDKNFINYVKKKLTFLEIDKSIKLSYLYEHYKSKYTAKKKKQLEKVFTGN